MHGCMGGVDGWCVGCLGVWVVWVYVSVYVWVVCAVCVWMFYVYGFCGFVCGLVVWACE